MSKPAFSPLVTLSDGNKMPLLGLGTWQSTAGDVKAAVKHAIKVGYRHVDCASLYGNEKEIGEALSEAMKEYGVTREELFITSKLWNNKHHPDDVETQCRKTLTDLGLDYLDLYLIHWPFAYQRGDEEFPADNQGNRLVSSNLNI
jgi:diketogulonate reductase-like aldo/keto reductase